MKERFDSPEYTGGNRGCQAPRCYAATRDGKPFCPKHVELHPYARGIMAVLERRKVEKTLAAKNKLLLNSQLVREAVHLLGRSSLTLERVAREMYLSHGEAGGVFNCLFRHGVATEGKSKRGKVTAALVRSRLQRA